MRTFLSDALCYTSLTPFCSSLSTHKNSVLSCHWSFSYWCAQRITVVFADGLAHTFRYWHWNHLWVWWSLQSKTLTYPRTLSVGADMALSGYTSEPLPDRCFHSGLRGRNRLVLTCSPSSLAKCECFFAGWGNATEVRTIFSANNYLSPVRWQCNLANCMIASQASWKVTIVLLVTR